jgi:hypothetical protein
LERTWQLSLRLEWDAATESESNAALASGMLFLLELEWHCQGQWA